MRSAIYKLIFAAIAFSNTCYAQDSKTAAVNSSRVALSSCVRVSTARFAQAKDLTPSGVALFVGLTCTAERDRYRSALKQEGLSNVREILEQVDANIVEYVIKSVDPAQR